MRLLKGHQHWPWYGKAHTFLPSLAEGPHVSVSVQSRYQDSVVLCMLTIIKSALACGHRCHITSDHNSYDQQIMIWADSQQAKIREITEWSCIML